MKPDDADKGVLHAISQHRIAPPAVQGSDLAADLIDQAFLSYNAGRLREVCQVFTRKMLDPDCTVGLAISGALTPAGLGMSCLIPLIRAGFVDWIVSTGANLYHDTHYALDLPLHQSRPNLDDHLLRQNDIIRIYDIVFDYATLLDTDAFYRELIAGEPFARSMGTAEFHHEVGRYLHARSAALGRPANSLLAAAFEAGGADLHVEPRRQLDRDEPGRARNCRGAGSRSMRSATSTRRPRSSTTPSERGDVGGPDPGRGQPEELHPPDRAADPGSPRPGRERPRLLPPDHRRPTRHRRPLGRDRERGDDLGQGRPRATPRLGHLLHGQHHRLAPPDGLRPGPARPRPLRRLYDRREALHEALRSEYLARQDDGEATGSGSGRSDDFPHPHLAPASLLVSLETRTIAGRSRSPEPRRHRRGGVGPPARGAGRLRDRDRLRPRRRRHRSGRRGPDLRGQGAAGRNPLIVHADGPDMARSCVASWPEEARILAEACWPGPLTLVLPRSARIPDVVTAGRETVGVRVPDTTVARR